MKGTDCVLFDRTIRTLLAIIAKYGFLIVVLSIIEVSMDKIVNRLLESGISDHC